MQMSPSMDGPIQQWIEVEFGIAQNGQRRDGVDGRDERAKKKRFKGVGRVDGDPTQLHKRH